MSRKFKRLRKQYTVVTIMALLLTSALITGFYFGDVNAKKGKSKTTQTVIIPPKIVKAINDTRENRILSDKMDQTVAACYYDLHQQNDTTTTPMNADICNSAATFFKQLCQTRPLEACTSDYFLKFLKGMEG